MRKLTFEERNLICIYSGGGTRESTIAALEEMRAYLEPDEKELMKMTNSALAKLRHMTDSDYDELDLIPDFSGEESAYGE